jgi:SSS family solute:Na+ symporter
MLTAIIVSLIERKDNHEHAIEISDINFSTKPEFNVSAVAISIVLIGLYTAWW